MRNEDINNSQLVLANAIDLASKVIQRVAGDNVASTIGGERITPAVVNATVAAKLQAKMAPYMERV